MPVPFLGITPGSVIAWQFGRTMLCGGVVPIAVMLPVGANFLAVTNRARAMSINWSQAAETAITTGLGEIPEVGSLLSGIVEIFWPQSQEDVWSEIKSQVEAVVGQAISDEVYSRVQAQLGSASGQSGLIGVIDNYLGSISKTDGNGENEESTWNDANTTFIASSSAFQEQGYEVLLLPLFTQMANLHLTLLRDGVIAGYCDASVLQQRITDYKSWADQYVQQAISDRKSSSGASFNTLNKVVRFMQINVGNFSQLWPYFDVSKYPPPVTNLPVGPEIFYTITEFISAMSLDSDNYSVPGSEAGNISNVDVYWVSGGYSDYTQVAGVEISYDSGAKTPYYGLSPNAGQAPPLNQSIYAWGTYSVDSTPVSETNYISAIHGCYSADRFPWYIQFIFKDGTYTQYIPPHTPEGGDTWWAFDIVPPAGYRLSSIWGPSYQRFYSGVYDLVFGFTLDRSSLPASKVPVQEIEEEAAERSKHALQS